MSDDFVTELQRSGIDPAVLPHAMQYFVAADSDYRPPSRMRDDLIAAGLDVDAIDQAAETLQRDPHLLEAACLAILQSGFADPASRPAAEGALAGAQTKLPVVEVSLVAIVAVYGMWLKTTKGHRTHETVIRRRGDGSWEQIEKTEWYGPAAPLEAIGRMLGLRPAPGGGADHLPGGEEPSLPRVPGDD